MPSRSRDRSTGRNLAAAIICPSPIDSRGGPLWRRRRWFSRSCLPFFLSADSGVVPRWKETNGLTPPSVIIVLCAAATTRQRSPGGEKKESRNRWLPGSNCRWRAYDLGLARRSPVAKRDLARVIYILTAALHTNMGLIVCTPSVPVFFFFFFFFFVL